MDLSRAQDLEGLRNITRTSSESVCSPTWWTQRLETLGPPFERAPVGDRTGRLRVPAGRPGNTSRTNMRAAALIGGARMASEGSATGNNWRAYRSRCGMVLIRFLKERMFGLTNAEGNHGEDVKEHYFYLE